MNKLVLAILVFVALVLFFLLMVRWSDRKEDAATWNELSAQQPSDPIRFSTSMVADLPEPAQRFFLFAIKIGTPLYTAAEISMKGEFSLGSQENPNYMTMTAEQILAPPHGFVWKLNAGKGLMQISGSDVAYADANQTWSRFWLFNIFPVARSGGNPDQLRSSFGRYVGEAVIWTPAALLPNENIRWDFIDDSTARVTLTHKGLQQSVNLTVDAEGKLNAVTFQRWSDANTEKRYQLQPFGGILSDFKEFGGFRLPTKVEAGHMFGTDEYFPFFKVNVAGIRFPTASDD